MHCNLRPALLLRARVIGAQKISQPSIVFADILSHAETQYLAATWNQHAAFSIWISEGFHYGLVPLGPSHLSAAYRRYFKQTVILKREDVVSSS